MVKKVCHGEKSMKKTGQVVWKVDKYEKDVWKNEKMECM